MIMNRFRTKRIHIQFHVLLEELRCITKIFSQNNQCLWPERHRRPPGCEIAMLSRLVVLDHHAESSSFGNAILIFDLPGLPQSSGLFMHGHNHVMQTQNLEVSLHVVTYVTLCYVIVLSNLNLATSFHSPQRRNL